MASGGRQWFSGEPRTVVGKRRGGRGFRERDHTIWV
jgi:hypothetical protein